MIFLFTLLLLYYVLGVGISFYIMKSELLMEQKSICIREYFALIIVSLILGTFMVLLIIALYITILQINRECRRNFNNN